MKTTAEIPVLETNRLVLLPWKLEYAEDMLTFASNEKVANAGGVRLITSIKKARYKIKGYINRNVNEWAIGLKSDRGFKIVGSIGISKFTSKKLRRSYRIYCLLAEEYWGQGLCTEAAQKVMHRAFIALNCDAVVASHKVSNMRSQKVIEKCGFHYWGIYPKHNRNKSNAQVWYYILKEQYFDLLNASIVYADIDLSRNQRDPTSTSVLPQKQTRHVKGSLYSLDNPIRIIDCISYIQEPTGYLCGQTCVAMLANVTVEEAASVIGTHYGTDQQDLIKGFDYYGIAYAPKPTTYDPAVPLPKLCVLHMKLPGYLHWGIYYDGIYYDPEFGISENCRPDAKIFQVWEIYE